MDLWRLRIQHSVILTVWMCPCIHKYLNYCLPSMFPSQVVHWRLTKGYFQGTVYKRGHILYADADYPQNILFKLPRAIVRTFIEVSQLSGWPCYQTDMSWQRHRRTSVSPDLHMIMITVRFPSWLQWVLNTSPPSYSSSIQLSLDTKNNNKKAISKQSRNEIILILNQQY